MEREHALARMRSAVELTRDAVKAVQVTSLDAIREGAAFLGVVGVSGELLDPFEQVEAPVWSQEPPTEVLEQAYDYCEELTKREAGNFYHSFKYLPEEKRRAMSVAYAFARRADDIADGDHVDRMPGADASIDPEAEAYRHKLEQLSQYKTVMNREVYHHKLFQLFYFRKKLSTCYNDLYSTDPIFLALKDVVKRFNIKREYFDELITGMEDDLYLNRYPSFDDLYTYCYRVASVAGLICIEIYGYSDEKAKEYGEYLGIFMQLTNILRDVAEDAERNRIYLPLDELAKYGITESDILTGAVKDSAEWDRFVKEFASLARDYLEKSLPLLPLLPREARYSPAAMFAFYERILTKIEKTGGDVFSKRVRLSKPQKILVAMKVLIKQRFFSR